MDGRFRIGAELGRGGVATVFAAHRGNEDAPLALKIARERGRAVEQRFRGEAMALAAIGAPFTPALVDRGTLDDGRPFVAMQRLGGGSLADRIGGFTGPPPLAWVRDCADAILRAVDAVHRAGFVHRDLKPGNIVNDGDGRPRLIDFGLARTAEDSAPAAAAPAAGTIEYMSPEQLEKGARFDPRSDIYSLGIIIYEMLALRPPFVGARAVVAHGHVAVRPPRLRELVRVPVALERLVLSCLAKEPARRPASVAELRDRLDVACRSRRVSAPAPRAALRTEGQRPIVLLGIDARLPASVVEEIVRASGGSLQRQRGERFVACFSVLGGAIDVAVSAARRLCEAGASRAIVHVASASLRRLSVGLRVFGAAIERPGSWMPSPRVGGVALTPAAAIALGGEHAAPEPGHAGVWRVPRDLGAALVSSAAAPTPLRGREQVMGQLRASIAEVIATGRPGLVTVIGEPGVGRSRLAAEAAIRFQRAAPAGTVIAHRARPPVATDADQTLRYLLRTALRLPDDAVPADPIAILSDRLGRDLADQVWPGVAVALGWRAAAAERPDALRAAAARALGEAFLRRAHAAPVAVVLDDAHLADDATLDALEHATRHGPGAPVWVLVTGTPCFERLRAHWGAQSRAVHRVELTRLRRSAARQLAAQLLHPACDVTGATLDRFAGSASGNPGILTELVRRAKRARIVRRVPGSDTRYVAAEELARLPPPISRQCQATRELDALPANLADLARLVSVLGVEVSLEEIEAVQLGLEVEGALTSMLEANAGVSRLCEREILQPSPPDQVQFRSAVFRDAVCASVHPRLRERAREHARQFRRRLRERLEAGRC